jgi:hypothetical protein
MRFASSAGCASFALCATLLAGCSTVTPSQSLPAGSPDQPSRASASGKTLVFNGRGFQIGSAAAQARAIQARANPNGIVLPPAALYVADPSLDGVMVYNQNATGANILPYGILAGAKSLVNGPVAVSVGTDLPCTYTGVCTKYLWVSNAGNNTITAYTLPLTAWNQVPAGVITWNGAGSCGPGISNPYGIVHYGPFGTSTPGTIFETSETLVTSSYYIVGFQAELFGSQPCDTSFTTAGYNSPSGPSIYHGVSDEIFNANRKTVTSQDLSPGLPPVIGGTGFTWALPNSPATEGTAIQQGTTSMNSYVWVTTSANNSYQNDALWRCQIKAFGLGVCASKGGGNAPVCHDPGAGLDDPAFPATSATKKWIYVPNAANGTVTSYKLGTPCTLKGTFVNTVSPFGTAVQD